MADKREEILEGILALPVLDVAWLVKELEAVSYTHLTLPTILLV